MSRILKKTLVASVSLLMLASAGATLNVNNPVNARHRRTHRVYRHRRRHYRYHTSLRHNAWLSGRYYGERGYFGTEMYYWRHDRRAFKAGFIVGTRRALHCGYKEANDVYRSALRASHHHGGRIVTDDDGEFPYDWSKEDLGL